MIVATCAFCASSFSTDPDWFVDFCSDECADAFRDERNAEDAAADLAYETAKDDLCEPDESMDGDWDSGMASAGFGTDEDYGMYGVDCDVLDYGDDDF